MAARKRRVTADVDEEIMQQADKVLSIIGLKSATVVQILFSRIAATGGIPFPIVLTAEEKKQLQQENKDQSDQ